MSDSNPVTAEPSPASSQNLMPNSGQSCISNPSPRAPQEHKALIRMDMASQIGEGGSQYYIRARARMLETKKRPSYPPSAFCLFSEQRRAELREAPEKMSQKATFNLIKREWRDMADKSTFKNTAS